MFPAFIYSTRKTMREKWLLMLKPKFLLPSGTTNQRNYEISVRLHPQENSIYSSSCTCPILDICKHIHKVLYRIRQWREIPIPPPSAQHLEQVARRERLADQMEHASVYVDFACKSELDSGSDYYRSQFV
jgi:hypothetical protein